MAVVAFVLAAAGLSRQQMPIVAIASELLRNIDDLCISGGRMKWRWQFNVPSAALMKVACCLVVLGTVEMRARKAEGQWQVDGVPVCTATGNQLFDERKSKMISDGLGGAFLTWIDYRSGTTSDIYAQHLLADGRADPAWPIDGRALCTSANGQFAPSIAPDGAGGAIVAWSDGRGGAGVDVFAQRIAPSGVVQWAPNGVAVCTANQSQVSVVVTADESGGVIIAWQDGRNGANHDIYAQHMLGSGSVDSRWPANGRALCTAVGNQVVPSVVSDHADGAIVSWQDNRSGAHYDVYAQRILNTGSVDMDWPSDGRLLSGSASFPLGASPEPPPLESDENGGAVVVWQTGSSLYAQHVLSSGMIDPTWPVTGSAVCTVCDNVSPSGTFYPAITSDEDGGALIAWNAFFPMKVHVQHILASGARDNRWPSDGRALSTASYHQTIPAMVSDNSGGAVVTWQQWGTDTYAQHVDASGVVDPRWGPEGQAICAAQGDQFWPNIVSDGAGGAIVSWQDRRTGTDWNIFAEQVSAVGIPGGTPMSIRVTAEVRPEHDNDALMSPAPPLPGVTVTLVADGQTWEATTGLDGIAGFPVEYEPGARYTLRLDGPQYTVKRQPHGGSLALESAQIAAAAGQTEYLWPYTRGVQAAYQIERFRRTYWKDRLNYEWQLPGWWEPTLTAFPIEVQVYETRLDALERLGGADADYSLLRCLTNKCEESDVLFHEFGHNVIFDRFAFVGVGPRRIGASQSDTEEGPAMDEGLADYFSCSFTADPKMDRCESCIRNVSWPCVCILGKRDLSKRKRYPRGMPYRYEAHEGSLILSGALWDLREALDGEDAAQAPVTDRLVFDALTHMIQASGGQGDYTFSQFFTALKAVDADQGSGHGAAIDAAFNLHNIGPLIVDYAPLAWAGDEGLAELDAIGPGQVTLRWHPLPGAVSYDVLMAPVSHVYRTGLAGNMTAITTAITDTFFTYAARDSVTEYLFSVVAVDDSGQAGYMATPGFVASPSPTGVGHGAPVLEERMKVWSTPNPFSATTTIHLWLQTSANLSARVFDASGRLLRVLARGRFPSGQHHLAWDGRDGEGRRLAVGAYVVVIDANGRRESAKLLLLR